MAWTYEESDAWSIISRSKKKTFLCGHAPSFLRASVRTVYFPDPFCHRWGSIRIRLQLRGRTASIRYDPGRGEGMDPGTRLPDVDRCTTRATTVRTDRRTNARWDRRSCCVGNFSRMEPLDLCRKLQGFLRTILRRDDFPFLQIMNTTRSRTSIFRPCRIPKHASLFSSS